MQAAHESLQKYVRELKEEAKNDQLNCQEIVEKLRDFGPLEAAQEVLEKEVAALKEQLGNAINEKYGSFVALPGQMGEVESGVARLREGLEPVVARVTAVRLNAVQELEQLQELLRERSAIRAWRQDIDRTRDAFAASDKVSKLLSRLDASHAAPGAQHLRLDQEARLLERGAAEIARLRFLIRARKDGEDAQPPLVPSLAEEGFPRQGLMAQHGAELTAELEAHSGDLVRKMRAALERALADALPGVAAAAGVGEAGVNGGIEVQGELDGKEQAGAHSAAHHIIHGMRTVGSDDAAQEVVRSALVRPLLNAVTDSASSSGGLPAFLRAAIAVARAACACVCGEAPSRSWGVEDGAHEGDGGAGGMPRHMLLAECVTAEIDSTVAVRFADWTSPGVPERFLGGLEAVVGFLTAAESLCMGKQSAMAFRSSPPVAALVARWNLRAFAALRFQEVAGPVEEALRGSALRGLSDRPSARVGGRDVRSAWLRAGWEALQQCIALRDPVWGLPGLAERMVRIALQVLERLNTHVAEAFGESRSSSWAEGASSLDVLALAADVGAFAAMARDEWGQRMSSVLGAQSARAGELVKGVIGEACGRLAASSREMVDWAAEGVARECSQAAPQIKGVVASFRMTNKPIPSAASPYVASLVAPLSRALSGSSAIGLPGPSAAALGERVAERLCGVYASQVSETLASVKRTEGSLAKLRKRAGGGGDGEGGGGPGGAGTLEKISAQMLLDVQETERLLREAGVAVDAPQVAEALQRLRAACRVEQDG